MSEKQPNQWPSEFLELCEEKDSAMSFLEWGVIALAVAAIVVAVGFTVGLICGGLG